MIFDINIANLNINSNIQNKRDYYNVGYTYNPVFKKNDYSKKDELIQFCNKKEQTINTISDNFKKIKNQQGIIGKAWNSLLVTKQKVNLKKDITTKPRINNNSDKDVLMDPKDELKTLKNRILIDKRFKGNDSLKYYLNQIMEVSTNQEQIKIAKKILTDEKLYSNDNILEYASDIVFASYNSNKAEIANKILSDEKLYNNKNILSKTFNLIFSSNDENRAEITKKILSDEKLYNNKTVMNIVPDLIDNITTKESYEVASKILSDENLYNNKFITQNISNIMYRSKTKEQAYLTNKILSDEKYYNNKKVFDYYPCIVGINEIALKAQLGTKILDNIDEFSKSSSLMIEMTKFIDNIQTKEQAEALSTVFDKSSSIIEFSDELYKLSCDRQVYKLKMYGNCTDFSNIVNFLKDDNLNKLITKVENQRQNVIKNPELYINGEYNNEIELRQNINKFFNKNYEKLLIFSSVLDDKTINTLFRQRFNSTEEYLHKNLSFENIELLSKLTKSKNVDGKPFSEKEKIGFIDLISVYNDNNMSTSLMQKMADEGIVDINKLNRSLFNNILKNFDLTEDEISKIPDEKLLSWNFKYLHLLSKEMYDNYAMPDLLKAASLEDFNSYIHNTSNIYGKSNALTKVVFEENGINYEKWLKPSKENNVHFVSKDNNKEKLSQISFQIKEDIESLMNTPVKGFIKKQFPNYIKNDSFVIPSEYITSKSKLNEFTENILKQLEPVFKRAKGNLDNPNKKEMAQNTLTIQNHLNQRLNDILQISDAKIEKTQDLTIKMWDRIPQKDLFQGNYSTCCIGMGDANSSAMFHYLMNTAYNMIEIVDNNSGKTIGNALCYFVKNEQGKPIFIIDNIEINNSNKPSDEVGIELRKAITEYASNVSKEITGEENTPIYMSSNYNDVPYKDLKSSTQQIEFLGDIDCDYIYMDLYTGWISKHKLKNKLKILELKN